MVVWWTKHQLGQKTTRHTPKHTPQGASRLVCGECVCDVWHVHISPTCIRPLATSGTFERCHGSVVAKKQHAILPNTRHKVHLDSCVVSVCATCGTCTSRQHAYVHSPRLARLKGVMVVWWTKHQLGQKTTRHTPKHTPQGASRLVCGECVCDVWHVHISRACIRPLATSGTFERCHGSVVAKKQHAILPNTRHKVHLDSCVVS